MFLKYRRLQEKNTLITFLLKMSYEYFGINATIFCR
jgi:hypothetical protein